MKSREYTPFYAAPCSVITRDEMEAILKRSDYDRCARDPRRDKLVRQKAKPPVITNAIRAPHFPELDYDNSVEITIDFDNQYARQGHLIAPLPPNYALIIANSLGVDALIHHDTTPRGMDHGTVWMRQSTDLEKRDDPFVREGDFVFKSRITSTVAGNTANDHLT